MTLSIIGDHLTSATRPHNIQCSANSAANETLLTTTHCSKRKIADEMHYSLPVGKRLHSQSIRTLTSAYNEQLISNEASKDKNSILNKRKREKCPYDKTDKSKASQVSKILGKSLHQKSVEESTSGVARLTKSCDNSDVNHTQDLPDLMHVMRPYPPTPVNNNTGTRKITV
jgi:hypothetical protein